MAFHSVSTSLPSNASEGSESTVPATKFSFRQEAVGDASVIETINDLAFGPGRYARTAYRLRGETPADPELCFVAECDGRTVATIRLTPIRIGARTALLLGPLAVDPAFKGQGAGRSLVRLATRKAERLGHGAVLLVGDAPYYGPLGYCRVSPGSIVLPGPVDPARLLIALLNDVTPEEFSGAARPLIPSKGARG